VLCARRDAPELSRLFCLGHDGGGAGGAQLGSKRSHGTARRSGCVGLARDRAPTPGCLALHACPLPQRNITFSGVLYDEEYVYTAFAINGAGESTAGTASDPYTLCSP
jgi:hypothetical protein